MSRALGLHHVTQRKNGLFERLRAWLRSEHDIDDAMIVIAILYPLTIVPQAIKIAQIQDAEAISITSFVLKSLFCVPWITYGIKHKSNPIILSNALWLIGYFVIISEALIF